MSVNTIVGSEPDGVIVAGVIITILDRDPDLGPLAQVVTSNHRDR